MGRKRERILHHISNPDTLGRVKQGQIAQARGLEHNAKIIIAQQAPIAPIRTIVELFFDFLGLRAWPLAFGTRWGSLELFWNQVPDFGPEFQKFGTSPQQVSLSLPFVGGRPSSVPTELPANSNLNLNSARATTTLRKPGSE